MRKRIYENTRLLRKPTRHKARAGMFMNEEQKKALEEIEGQLYAINARNISLQWIGLKKKPTMEEITTLNQMLSFIIEEIRTLRETGELDIDSLHKKIF